MSNRYAKDLGLSFQFGIFLIIMLFFASGLGLKLYSFSYRMLFPVTYLSSEVKAIGAKFTKMKQILTDCNGRLRKAELENEDLYYTLVKKGIQRYDAKELAETLTETRLHRIEQDCHLSSIWD